MKLRYRAQDTPKKLDRAGDTQLHQLQTQALPTFRQQLIDLLASFDVFDLEEREFNPKLGRTLDTLEILSRITPTFDEISAFVHSIARIAFDSSIDHTDGDYGDLKKFRSHLLVTLVDQLLQDPAGELFFFSKEFLELWNVSMKINRKLMLNGEVDELAEYKERMITAVANSSELIDTIIHSSKRSDFRFLQDHCQHLVSNLEECVNYVRHQIYSRSEPSHGPTLDKLTSSSQPLSLRSLIAQLFESALPLFKLVKISFNRLLDKKPPFTINTRITSGELQTLLNEIRNLDSWLMKLMRNLTWMYERNDINYREEDFVRIGQMISVEFNSSLSSLSSLLIPTPGTPLDCGSSESSFSVIKGQVAPAVATLTHAIDRFELAVQRLSN
ncbi:hypothetical protein PtA15_8A636 [Puccinia triticina]|uniref:Uncharacterized protein n=1 Tax=Puccinia triticina TaxID=208348 RepID=A0ABY7CRS6_9BASI|nr:uncharacterized protein PtA15_8A636 [Puccinia triticina]WAQ87730.1 hypothetical protein PtA15_8A636 [Puccinia triticina]